MPPPSPASKSRTCGIYKTEKNTPAESELKSNLISIRSLVTYNHGAAGHSEAQLSAPKHPEALFVRRTELSLACRRIFESILTPQKITRSWWLHDDCTKKRKDRISWPEWRKTTSADSSSREKSKPCRAQAFTGLKLNLRCRWVIKQLISSCNLKDDLLWSLSLYKLLLNYSCAEFAWLQRTSLLPHLHQWL